MPVALPEELVQPLSGETTPIFLATLDANGRPNVVPVISITPYETGALVFGEFLMNKTRKNLLVDEHVGVTALAQAADGAFHGWSIRGTFLGFETTGPRVDMINALPMLRYNAYTGIRAAGTIRVESVSERRVLGKLAVLANFLRVSAAARLLGGARPAHRCMPARVEEKFQRMSAVRAVAFRDKDGFPHTFPAMACVPAGPNRLAIADPFFNAAAPAIALGAELAVSIIT
ncbi:MAG: pyridoxamine 5'-phosphate oxidase family protein, partial [Candidatus Hydrogenedentes bacterium]|nr:pyridoxamine 5'-phosphate oxidase family protein [Candidatus Hydrogenedentota bacterium]